MDYNIIIREECHFVNWPFFEVLTAESSGIITLATDIDYGIFVFNFPLIEKYGEKKCSWRIYGINCVHFDGIIDSN